MAPHGDRNGRFLSGRGIRSAGTDPVRQEIGTLEHVLEVPSLDLFDGIVVATDWGLRFINAGRVELITIRSVRCSLDDAEADRLPPPDGAAVYTVSALDEIGDSLHERLAGCSAARTGPRSSRRPGRPAGPVGHP